MASVTDDFRNPSFGANADIDTSAEVVAADVPCRAVQFKADPANDDYVYIGRDTNVTAATGYPLSAGQETVVFFGIDNVNDFWAIGGAANQALHYVYWV